MSLPMYHQSAIEHVEQPEAKKLEFSSRDVSHLIKFNQIY